MGLTSTRKAEIKSKQSFHAYMLACGTGLYREVSAELISLTDIPNDVTSMYTFALFAAECALHAWLRLSQFN